MGGIVSRDRKGNAAHADLVLARGLLQTIAAQKDGVTFAEVRLLHLICTSLGDTKGADIPFGAHSPAV
jgi:hypothetical protein